MALASSPVAAWKTTPPVAVAPNTPSNRLFGTYKAEDAAVPLKYGLVHPVTTNNPLVIVYGDFIEPIRELWSAKSWGDRWRLIFMPPGWRPEANESA
jgi:hypothetical protein